jgi:hypothetical protein
MDVKGKNEVAVVYLKVFAINGFGRAVRGNRRNFSGTELDSNLTLFLSLTSSAYSL